MSSNIYKKLQINKCREQSFNWSRPLGKKPDVNSDMTSMNPIRLGRHTRSLNITFLFYLWHFKYERFYTGNVYLIVEIEQNVCTKIEAMIEWCEGNRDI